jgi:hypothetical protein
VSLPILSLLLFSPLHHSKGIHHLPPGNPARPLDGAKQAPYIQRSLYLPCSTMKGAGPREAFIECHS